MRLSALGALVLTLVAILANCTAPAEPLPSAAKQGEAQPAAVADADALPVEHPLAATARQDLAVTIAAESAALPEDDPASAARKELGRRECIALMLALCRGQSQAVQSALVSSSSREAQERCSHLARSLDVVLSFARGYGVFDRSSELDAPAFALSESSRAATIVSAELARGAARSPKDHLPGTDLDLAVLVKALGDDAASVSFRRFSARRIVRAPPASETSSEELCAFVAVGGGSLANRDAAESVTRVDLGPIEPIERVVLEWRDAVGAAHDSREVHQAGDRLRELVFDPLRQAIGKRRRIVLVPDDVLHLVAFDALPLGANSMQLVGDRWRIETRATLHEILKDEPLPNGEPSLLAIGGVRYGGSMASTERLRGATLDAGFFDLPATAEEAAGVDATFRTVFGAGASTTLLADADASRQKLIDLAPRVRYLHVATHGWFSPHSVRSWSGSARMSGADQVMGMSPMLLCGIALAGANEPEDAVGRRAPGLVTAEELSTLELSNCELAVLSAGDTHVGVRRAGQGVASAQSALQMAGARSVITALWKVPDEATKDLMLDFYRRLWVERKPKWQALWEAKQQLRDEKDESGAPKYCTRDWAAWVLTGFPD